jgi:hypothetical protein
MLECVDDPGPLPEGGRLPPTHFLPHGGVDGGEVRSVEQA